MAEHPLQRKIADALRLPSTHRVGWGIGQKKAAEKVQDPPPAHFYGRNRGMSLPRRVHSNNKHISFIARE